MLLNFIEKIKNVLNFDSYRTFDPRKYLQENLYWVIKLIIFIGLCVTARYFISIEGTDQGTVVWNFFQRNWQYYMHDFQEGWPGKIVLTLVVIHILWEIILVCNFCYNNYFLYRLLSLIIFIGSCSTIRYFISIWGTDEGTEVYILFKRHWDVFHYDICGGLAYKAFLIYLGQFIFVLIIYLFLFLYRNYFLQTCRVFVAGIILYGLKWWWDIDNDLIYEFIITWLKLIKSLLTGDLLAWKIVLSSYIIIITCSVIYYVCYNLSPLPTFLIIVGTGVYVFFKRHWASDKVLIYKLLGNHDLQAGVFLFCLFSLMCLTFYISYNYETGKSFIIYARLFVGGLFLYQFYKFLVVFTVWYGKNLGPRELSYLTYLFTMRTLKEICYHPYTFYLCSIYVAIMWIITLIICIIHVYDSSEPLPGFFDWVRVFVGGIILIFLKWYLVKIYFKPTEMFYGIMLLILIIQMIYFFRRYFLFNERVGWPILSGVSIIILIIFRELWDKGMILGYTFDNIYDLKLLFIGISILCTVLAILYVLDSSSDRESSVFAVLVIYHILLYIYYNIYIYINKFSFFSTRVDDMDVGAFWHWNSMDYILEYSRLTSTENTIYYLPYALYLCALLFILCLSLAVSIKEKLISLWIQGLTLLVLISVIFLYIAIFFNTDIIKRPVLLFNRGILLNYFTTTVSGYILFFTILFLMGSWKFFFSEQNKKGQFIEYPILIGFAVFFLLALISSYDLMVVYLTLEGLSIVLYVLAAYPFKQSSLEASIKYYSLGSLSSGILLFGISLVYGIVGAFDFLNIKFFFAFGDQVPYLTLNFTILCLIFGFLFKLSAFPCHMWAPDVYEGTWLPTTIFFMVVVKMGLFFFFIRFLIYLFYNVFFICQTILLISAIGSIIIGSFGSLYQQGIKRLLSYTSISQVGFAFLGLSCGTPAGITSSILFFIAYIVASMGIFIILINVESFLRGTNVMYLSDLTNFSNRNRSEAILLTIFLLSMAGIPPLAGFYGKLSIFLAIIGSQLYTFTLLAIILSTVNAYIYVRIIKVLWSDSINLGLENFKLYDYFLMFPRSSKIPKSKVMDLYELIIKYMLRVLLFYIITVHTFITAHLEWSRALMYTLITIVYKSTTELS